MTTRVLSDPTVDARIASLPEVRCRPVSRRTVPHGEQNIEYVSLTRIEKVSVSRCRIHGGAASTKPPPSDARVRLFA